MKNRILFGLFVTILTFVLFTAVSAEETYTFELTEAAAYKDGNENWSVEISAPQISGMADEAAQDSLNAYFLQVKDDMIAGYEQDAEYAAKNKAEGLEPHFMYQYSYEVVTDSEDYFVFRTLWFMAAGSSTTLTEYWTLDKKTGNLVNFNDVVTSPEQLASIREQIFAKMLEINESEDGMYWTEDDSLDLALGQLEALNHWYINEDGKLVIVFDKYEIAPGAMGNSEFIIDD